MVAIMWTTRVLITTFVTAVSLFTKSIVATKSLNDLLFAPSILQIRAKSSFFWKCSSSTKSLHVVPSSSSLSSSWFSCMRYKMKSHISWIVKRRKAQKEVVTTYSATRRMVDSSDSFRQSLFPPFLPTHKRKQHDLLPVFNHSSPTRNNKDNNIFFTSDYQWMLGTLNQFNNFIISIGSWITTSIRQIFSYYEPKQYIQWTGAAIQLGLILYFARVVWMSVSEVITELNEQYLDSNNQQHEQHLFPVDDVALMDNPSDVTRIIEHFQAMKAAQDARMDLLSVNETNLSNLEWHSDFNRSGTSTETSPSHPGKPQSLGPPRSPLLLRISEHLLAAGFPLQSIANDLDYNSNKFDMPSIESLLLQLTRSEAALLLQCLWISSSPSHYNSPHHLRHHNDHMLWDSVSGLQSVKERLLGTIAMILPTQDNTTNNFSPLYSMLPISHADKLQRGFNSLFYGLDDRKESTNTISTFGVLLYGPPGCGKTLLVKSLASVACLPCLVVTPSVLLRKYVGETNLQVRSLFTLAAKLSPCIVCIDELDGLFRERSSSPDNEHEVSRDLKTEFLQWLDGMMTSAAITSTTSSSTTIPSTSSHMHVRKVPSKHFSQQTTTPIHRRRPILVIGATNRPFDVDSAILRRLSQSHYVGLPKLEDRMDLLKQLLRDPVPTDPKLDLYEIAVRSEGYSPSDIKQVLQTAAMIGPFRRATNLIRSTPFEDTADPDKNISSWIGLTTTDVLNALKVVSPSPCSPQYRALLENFMRSRREMPGTVEQVLTNEQLKKNHNDNAEPVQQHYGREKNVDADASDDRNNIFSVETSTSDNKSDMNIVNRKQLLRKWETNLGNFYDVGTLEVDAPTFDLLVEIFKEMERGSNDSKSDDDVDSDNDDTND